MGPVGTGAMDLTFSQPPIPDLAHDRVAQARSSNYWPLVGTAFGAGAVDVALDDAVVLNGYPGGPFT